MLPGGPGVAGKCLVFRPAEQAIESIEHPNFDWHLADLRRTPHDLAVIKGPNWSSILRAGDTFAMDDVPIDIGPTRQPQRGHCQVGERRSRSG